MTSTHLEPDQPTIDHILPRAKGGGNAKENLRWVCFRCNSMKADRLQCTRCREYKDASAFPADKHKRNGLGSACQKCVTDFINDYYKTEKGKAKRSARNATRLGRERRMFNSAKQRAKSKKLEFTITLTDVKLPEDDLCPVLGIPILLQDYQSDNSPSLDRIDNSRGYTPENVMVISNRANRLKRNGTAEEHYRIFRYMTNQLKKDDL